MSATPTSSSKRKETPSSSKGSAKKKKGEKSETEGTERKFRYLMVDSDDNSGGEDEEGQVRPEWKIVPAPRDPPTRPNSKYVQTRKEIQVREDKPIPPWWKMTKVLRTEKKQSTQSKDQGDNKLRDFFFKLNEDLVTKEEEEEKVDEIEVEEVLSGQSDKLTPLSGATPETIKMKNSEWTMDMRKRVLKHLEPLGWDGMKVPGTNYNVAYRGPDERGGRLRRPYHILLTVSSNDTSFVCFELGCFSTQGVRMKEFPKCRNHKGEKTGFVVAEFTDGENKRHNVIFHVIASFTFDEDDDEEVKDKNATDALKKVISGSGSYIYTENGWQIYCQERLLKGQPKPEAVEIVGKPRRRRYFEEEDDAMKIYSSRQTVTLLKMLLWPNTRTKIICINEMINFPNGAYQEFKEEMDYWGLELRVHDTLKKEDANNMLSPVPYLKVAQPGDTIGSMLKSEKKKCDDEEEDDDDKKTEEKVAVLYFVSNPYILYPGQTTSPTVHNNTTRDPVIFYKQLMGDDPMFKIIPFGTVKDEEKYKWEAHHHIAAFFASALKMQNCINPDDYDAESSHPYCINKQTSSKYFDKKSLGIINELMKKYFCIDIYLGAKAK
ncbi:hypothetical protein Fcan01_09410 [Folsomia candida]|uniref:Uncharacterized protein n=1 Tax=Folsomia candida TaxID=158441 RepID=A0A226EFV1_FOLCA|nr:hypothetical protein Fcan01_09410 [Folsomia candida]